MINNNEEIININKLSGGYVQTSNLPAKRGRAKAVFIDLERCIEEGCIDPDIYLSVDNNCDDCDNCWVLYDKVGDN